MSATGTFKSTPIIATEHAVAKLIGWEIQTLASDGPSLLAELRQHKDSAISEYIEAEEAVRAASGATAIEKATNTLAEKMDSVHKFEALIEKATLYLQDIREELAKGESSEIVIDKQSSEWTGDEYLTQASVEWWVRKKYNISMTSYDDFSAAPQAEIVKSLTKKQVVNAFGNIHYSLEQWSKYLATPPKWLASCRVAKGNKSTPSSWNPVQIAIALMDRNIPVKKLDAVFVGLKDWQTEWSEASEHFR